jgi:hypothetical protein
MTSVESHDWETAAFNVVSLYDLEINYLQFQPAMIWEINILDVLVKSPKITDMSNGMRLFSQFMTNLLPVRKLITLADARARVSAHCDCERFS